MAKEDAPPFLLVSTGQAIIAVSTIFGFLSNPVAGGVTGHWGMAETKYFPSSAVFLIGFPDPNW